jgi:hypothetical protein
VGAALQSSMVEPQLTLANMVDDAIILSLEHQLVLADVLGEHTFDVDLKRPRLELRGDRRFVCSQFHFLGTAAPGPRSWLWSWANGGNPNPALTALASTLATFGGAQRIAPLTEAEIPFSALPGGVTTPHQAVSSMIDAAKAFSGLWFSYNFDAGGGTRAAFLLEHPDLTLPEPDTARVMRVIHQSITTFFIEDHRRALHSYAVRRPLDFGFNPDYSALTLRAPNLRIDITFDQLGYVTGIEGNSATV